MNLWESIRWAALRDVFFSVTDRAGGDPEYFYRKVCRWYSEKFSTELHVVETLPMENVTRAWFEDQYETMDLEELKTLVKEMSMSVEEKAKQQREEDRQARFGFEDEQDAREHNRAVSKRLEDVILPVQNALDQLMDQTRAGGRESELVQRGSQPPLTGLLPQDIKMTFISEEEMEEELEKDSFGLFDDLKKTQRK